MKEVKRFIALIKNKSYVCPNPMVWNDFYLKFKVKDALLKPLILGAWHHTSDTDKINRLKEQLESISIGQDRQEAIAFLEKLPDSDWYKKNK
jgi:hypothetical protein